MKNNEKHVAKDFYSLLDEIPHIGFKVHAADILRQAQANKLSVEKTLKDIPPLKGKKAESGIVISAGPSLHRRKVIQRIVDSHYQGTTIAVDGAYAACLRAGFYPDFVVTLDPNSTRVVRWFGDPDFETHSKDDDYFVRQDLDVDFRKNSIEHNNMNIELVNKYGHRTKAIVATCSPINVVNRLKEGGLDMYWWNPLVDDPNGKDSITRQLFELNKAPCMNTGGNVGTAAWVFAATRLKLPKVALTGMDLGYYDDTPLEKTQTYYELMNHHLVSAQGVENFFMKCTFPLTGEKFYTDPTYFWYRQNLIDLLKLASDNVETFNCTEAGTLIDKEVLCATLDEFIKSSSLSTRVEAKSSMHGKEE